MKIFVPAHQEYLVKQASPLEPSPRTIFLTTSVVRSVE